MKKILLIGELGDILRSLNDCLVEEFQVQLCSEQVDMIRNMAKIVRPELILVCQIGVDELDHAIFSWIREQQPATPVLVISTSDGWGKIRDYCRGGQFGRLFRPVTKQELIDKCNQMLKNGQAEQKGLEKAKTPSLEENADSAVVQESRQGAKQYKIMVVDDSPLVLRNTKNILEEEYQVFLAPSGEKALELIPKKQPDLVLLDYEMPGMDGKQVYEIMLKDEYMRTIPVIFLTAIARKDQVFGVLRSKPAGYILKPADKERLFEEIHKVL